MQRPRIAHGPRTGDRLLKTRSRSLPFVPVVLALFMFSSTAATAVELPSIGDSTDSYLSTEEERRLGEAFMRNISQSLEIVEDPEVKTYIQSLGYRLVANSGMQGRGFTFFVVNDHRINAFAGPGGYIGINTGLILATDTEAELASVLAHEIAHVTQRHLARAFEAASRMSLPVTAAIIAAIILGQRSGELGEAALAATAAGSAQKQINFTRANEQEADRIGLQILANSGYDPRAMPRFFEELQQAGQLYENLQFEFLRTHPVTTSRIADTLNRAEQYEVTGDNSGPSYDLIRAKVRIIQDSDPIKSIEYFERQLNSAPAQNQEVLRYGYALALTRAGRLKEARAQVERLISADPERIAYQLVLAAIEQAAGDIDAALKIYKRNLDLYPYDLALTEGYAQALILDDRPDEARRLLSDYLREREPVPLVHRLLARAESTAGRPAQAHEALSEYYYLIGQTRTAIEQIKIALRKMPGDDDNYEAKLRARLRKLENEWLLETEQAEESQ